METIKKIAYVDIETTGPSFSEGDRMIQIAAIIIENGQIIGEHSMLINPEREIPTHIQNLTGIKQEEVDKAPTFGKVANLWLNRLQDCLFVAHNLAFDLPFIEKSFEASHLTFDCKYALDSEWIARIMLPSATGFNLTELAQNLGIEFHNAHDAKMDALVTARILSDLAQAFYQLPGDASAKLVDLSRFLKHNEQYFFENPGEFILIDNTLRVSQASQIETKLEDPLAKWILNQFQLNERVIVKANRAPLPLDTKRNLVHQITEPTVFVTNDVEYYQHHLPQSLSLKNKNEFLSRAALNWLIDHLHHLNLNQNELLQLLGVYQWSFVTQSGLLDELNSDIAINQIFEKHVPSHFMWHDDAYYQHYLKILTKTPYLLVNHQQIYKLKGLLNSAILKTGHYQLFIDDLGAFVYQLYAFNRLEIPLSQHFIELQNYYDSIMQMDELPETLKSLTEPMLSALKQINGLLISLLDEFKKEFTSFSKVQVQRYLVCEQELNQYLINQLTAIKQQLEQLRALSNEFHLDFQQYLEITLKGINSLLKVSLNNGDILIKSVQFNHNFFHLVLEYNDLQSDLGVTTILDAFNKVLILDQDYLETKQNVFGNNNLFESLKKINVPDIYYQKKLIKIPFGYLIDAENAIEMNDFEAMSYFQEKAAKAQVAFLKDNLEQCQQKIMIISPNRATVEYTYNLLSHDGTFKPYQLLAEGVTGSGRKVIRNFNDNDLSIMIISRHKIELEQLPTYDFIFDIFIHTLPFTSQNHPLSKKIKQFKGWSNNQLFDYYLIAKMLGDFSQTLSLLNDFYPDSQIYLFDERIYTKYYSSQVREYFERWINFEIMD